MFHASRERYAWIATGLVLGLIAGGLWPDSPAHAVATAQQDNFAICTAPVDEDGEAIFFLDFLTGDLKGAMIQPQVGKFTVFYQTNIVADLGVDVSKSPRFLLVSGVTNFPRRAGGPQLGNAVVYVAELSSGKVAAYGVPSSRGSRAGPAAGMAPFAKLDVWQFRNVAIRNQ